MKISLNAPCPCHSGKKYKQCCQPYHKGIPPSNALKLMRSRYSAYALGIIEYIIATTHPNNPDASIALSDWQKAIDHFAKSTYFQGLKITEFADGEEEAFVTFEATLSDGIMREKSRFLKVEGKWLYESGVFS
ncbi:YchJ family metal-binding protein [Sulfuricurvum sp.]|uniref:YchJ family protein n=1 Tax=Sulfuricurvum sp. TaxID=2025608 RepID=UPI0019BA2B33|nr:YchJ family metal-binding protein [Sulfuricurvum sp.]MBD3799709.1 SEC-C domain-containing protein [Campylobacterota bacterium]MBD3806612.1 SEC-C domain-containing protein [Sulfuricurvum sp.]